MKTIRPIITVILIVAAGSLPAQHYFEQTAYLDWTEKSMDQRKATIPDNNGRSAKQQFANAMTVADAAAADFEHEAAADLYEFAAGVFPGSVEAHCGAGISRYLSGNIELARLHFISALKSDPDHARSHFGLAQVQIQTGAISDVCEHLRFAFKGGVGEARNLMDRYCTETQTDATGDYRDF